MSRFVWLLVLAGSVSAQTVGLPGLNDLRVNGGGSGEGSCSDRPLALGPQFMLFEIVGLPNTPVAVGLGACAPGFVPGFAGGTSLDIDLSWGVVYDGTGTLAPTPPNLPASTGSTLSTGQWAFLAPVTVDVALNGLTVQGALLDPTAPGLPWRTTQAHRLRVGPVPASLCPQTLGGDLSPLTDDGFVAVALASPGFWFYGSFYSTLFVNMNGNLTFGSGDTDFSATEVEFLTDQPRIAPAWDDWSPGDPLQGSVRAFDDPTVFVCEWLGVRHFGASCAGLVDSNTFCVMLDKGSLEIVMIYGEMGLCGASGTPSADQVVGISPGGLLPLPTHNVDLWPAGPVVGGPYGPMVPIYEAFTPNPSFGPFDFGPSFGANTGLRFTPTAPGATSFGFSSF